MKTRDDLIRELRLKEAKTAKGKVSIIIKYFWDNYNTHNPKKDLEFRTWEEEGQREQYIQDKLKDILEVGAKSWGKDKVTIEELKKYGFGENYDTNDILRLDFLPHTCTSASYIAFDLLDACNIKVRILRGEHEGKESNIPRESKYAFNLNTHCVVEYFDEEEQKLIKFDAEYGAYPEFFRNKAGKLLKDAYDKFRFEPWQNTKRYYFTWNEKPKTFVNVKVIKSNFE